MKADYLKTCHFFWSGNSLPFIYYLSILSFRRLNPDWKICLYSSFDDLKLPTWSTNEQANSCQSLSRDYTSDCRDLADEYIVFDFRDLGFANNLHPVHKADILRQYLMFSKGGLWSDMDIIWTKPMADFEEEILQNVDTVLCFRREVFLSATAFSLGNENPIYRSILEEIKRRYDLKSGNIDRYQIFGPSVLKATGIGNIIFCWRDTNEHFTIDRIPKPSILSFDSLGQKIVNIREKYFYPYWFDRIDDFFKAKGAVDLSPIKDSIGIHWFGGSPLSVEPVNFTTKEYVDKIKSPSSTYEFVLKETLAL